MPAPPQIRAATHPVARQLRLLARGGVRERREEGLFVVEGPRGLHEALAAGAVPAWVVAAEGRAAHDDVRPLLARSRSEGAPVYLADDALLARLAPSETGPGLVAACPLPLGADDARALISGVPRGQAPAPGSLRTASQLLVCTWGVQNPGNLGTLVRSACAFGAAGFLAVAGADPWNPKAVRASAGAIHRLPVARAADAGPAGDAGDLLEGWRLVAAMPRGGVAPASIDWSGRVALLLGSEVAGVPGALAGRAERVTIPIRGEVESLSVAVAGSLLIAAAAR